MTKYCFIFLITGDFYSFHRKTMITKFSEFIKPNNVLVINRPFDFLTSFRKPKKLFEKSFNKYSENLYVFKPYLFIHDQIALKLPQTLKTINYFFFQKQLKSILKRINSNLDTKIIVWTMHPDLNDYLGHIPKDYLIYDCYDEFIVKNAVSNIEKREKELFDLSNLIITSSKYLKEKKENLYSNNRVFHSSTAVDINLFTKDIDIKNLPEDIKNIPHPIIGFAGSIREDLDIETIKFIAQKRKDFSIVFVGKIHPNFNKDYLKGFDNIYFLGEKRLDEFPYYLKCFDVAICPQILNEFVKSASPYKIYQYLASNLDVVTSPIPEMIDFHQKVAVAYSKEKFLEKIEIFLNSPKINFSEDELKIFGWENRFENILKKIDLEK